MRTFKLIGGTLVLLALVSGVAFGGFRLLRQARSAQAAPRAPEGMDILYLFSGATDDGKKGAADRKEATAVTCTNANNVTATIQVKLYQWNGALVGNGSVNVPPLGTRTFSTQNTTLYFDDVILATGGGTDAIFQGSGEVLSNRGAIVCTAIVLDPLGYPPVFMDRLTLYHKDGTLLGDDRLQYVPAIVRR